ncbi:MAG: BspA family leucine-rich repeat surface protein [Oscillospiraceae bacterium]|nr:BspA family leucine-rich repeat surface protein [Oscillospiraceae bacterium]
MKKLFSIVLALVLILTTFTSCGKPKTALTATELLDLGEKYLLDLDYEQAIVYFNQVIEVEPRNSRAYMGAAEAYIGLGDTESAINILKTALEVFSDDESVTIGLLEMLIEIDPTTAEWYLDLAQIYINQENTDKAIEVLQQGLTNASTITEIAALLMQLMNGEVVEVETIAETSGSLLDNDMLHSPTYFDKTTITEIDFLDSLDSAPADAWDFSLDSDGSVLGWLDGTHLYVAGDGGVIADEDASELFSGYSYKDEYGDYEGTLREINFNGCFDTSNVVDMRSMFDHGSELITLDVSNFDTSNVTDMSCMFRGCRSITELDVSGFDTSNVTDMRAMFELAEYIIMGGGSQSKLQSLDVSGFDTSKVTNMSDMFCFCVLVEELDVSNFDTSNVVYMGGMFYECRNISSIDLSNFDTSNVVDMGSMFSGCYLLESIDVSKFDTSKVEDMSGMFAGCNSLVTLDLSGFDTSKVTDMGSMFDQCKSLVVLDLSSFDTSNVTNMSYMFYQCSSLTTLDISSFDMTNADTSWMFLYTIFD